MREVHTDDAGSLFAFGEPADDAPWAISPGAQTVFALRVRNETEEGHEVAVVVEEPSNWAWVEPRRLSLGPGEEKDLQVVFAPQSDSRLAAGTHTAIIRVRDFEGVIFAEYARPYTVAERQELSMTAGLRGPLLSFGMAEGFVVHCQLVNRGNVDVTVTPAGDNHPTLSFSKRTVLVPFQGEVGFDVEVRWQPTRRDDHPEAVTLRARYQGGEASASVPWERIEAALEPFMPVYSMHDEEDELLSLSWLPAPGQDPLEHRLHPTAQDAGSSPSDPAVACVQPSLFPENQEPADGGDADEGNRADKRAGSSMTAVPSVDGQTGTIAAAPAAARTHGGPGRPTPMAWKWRPARAAHPVNPWWPVAQKLGGRWRVKPLPILMAVIAIEGFWIGYTQAQRDFYASPALRGPVAPFMSAFNVNSHLLSTLTAAGKKAVRLAVGPSPDAPALWNLKAHYVTPHRLAISFNEKDLSDLHLIVASGLFVIYNRPLSQPSAEVPIRGPLSANVRVTASGRAHNGVVLRQTVYLPLPFALQTAHRNL
jgi:hypothetical protein